MPITIQRSAVHDRGTLTASNTYGRPIQVDAGTGLRILLGMNSGRFTPDNLTVPTRNGQAFSQLGDSTTTYAEREVVWELRNPDVGTFNFVTNTIDNANINDGTWWWMVLQDTNGSAGVATVLGSGGAVSLTPPATVGATDLAFCIGSSVAYAGGGALSGSGATNIAAPIAGRSGVYAIGSVPGIGPWASNQCAAVTVVVAEATAPDTINPTLTGAISLSGVTTTGFTATCPVATDNVAVNGYQYNLDSAGWVDIAAGGRSITFTGKTPGATYSVQMRAKDAVPNYSSPLTASQTLPTGGDTTLPTLTGAVVATAVTQTGYTLTWPAGADNVDVTSYERSLDGGATWTDVGNVLTGAVTGRTPGATDQVRIRAKDAAGNVSTPALSLAVPLDVYKCSILDWVLPTNSQHAIGEQWNISFHNVSTRALVAYAPAAALVAGVNGAGQASRNLVVGNAAFVQGTTYAWFATHPTNATWFAVGLATAA